MSTAIPECPAYETCRAMKAVCDVCMTLDIPEWKEHVKRVLRRKKA